MFSSILYAKTGKKHAGQLEGITYTFAGHLWGTCGELAGDLRGTCGELAGTGGEHPCNPQKSKTCTFFANCNGFHIVQPKKEHTI